MDCFTSLIGCRGLTTSSSSSQLFVDSVGINRALLEDINYTHADLVDLFNDKLDFASTQVAAHVKRIKAKELRTVDMIESTRVGFFANNRATVSARSGFDAGAVIEVREDRDYVKIYVSSISLFVDYTGDVTVTVYDLQTGQSLDTITVSATAGQPAYVNVDKTYRANKRWLSLAFVYDSSFDSYKTNVLNTGACASCGGYRKRNGRFTWVRGARFADGSDKVISNITEQGDTAGMSIAYQVHCDYDEWMCRSRNLLSLALLYKTGYEIAQYGLESTRLNHATMENEAILQMIMDKCETMYNEEIMGALSAMEIPPNEYCFQCGQKSKHVTTL